MDKDGIEIALEDLDHMVELVRQHRSISFFLGVVHSANTIKKALEKQLPAKIEIHDYGKAFCPKCKTDIHGIGRTSHCLNCGQKLDW